MQVWTEIRRKVLVEKVSRRQICRDYGRSHHTDAKILDQHYHRHREVFVPLVQPPGEAQFDFGGAVVEISVIRVKAALAVMSLP
jgi:hypothetical protein